MTRPVLGGRFFFAPAPHVVVLVIGLVPGIRVFLLGSKKTWMAGASPAM
jgi:hypothetical protein